MMETRFATRCDVLIVGQIWLPAGLANLAQSLEKPVEVD